MRTDYPNVLVVGPYASLGGIASVIRMHRGMRLWRDVNCRLLSTYDERSSYTKIAAMLRAYLLGMVEIYRASLVHIHVAAQNSMWRKLPIVVLAKLMRKPYILHLHAASEGSVFEQTPLWLVRFLFLLSYRVIVLSDSWERIVKEHVPHARVTVIHNPVCRPPLPSTEKSSPIVFYAGKLEPRKGFIDLLEAAAEVLNHFPGVKFCFAGHGQIEEAKAKSRNLGIEASVSFLGWLGAEEVAEYYRRATIFCLPSYDEGLPMAVIEAMSYSLPVLTTPVGGLPDLISDGVDGLFARPGDVDAITHQLLGLLRNPDRATRIGRNAALTVERTCNPALIERQLLTLYQEVNAEWQMRKKGIPESSTVTLHAQR